ncbi:hypothetical protein C8R42DRAFT_666086 [Lentinula raphanica]|nr:hypothetical protein C8R42DRAFT_666086 [Lentinula raphanica]
MLSDYESSGSDGDKVKPQQARESPQELPRESAQPAEADEGPDSDSENIYESSEAEREDWQDEIDPEQDWPVKVVGVEVANGDEIHYEARWPGWSRSDGTTNTFHRKGDPYSPLRASEIREWEKARKHKVNHLMETVNATDITAHSALEIEMWSDNNILNSNTRYHAQLFDEKLAIIEGRMKKGKAAGVVPDLGEELQNKMEALLIKAYGKERARRILAEYSDDDDDDDSEDSDADSDNDDDDDEGDDDGEDGDGDGEEDDDDGEEGDDDKGDDDDDEYDDNEDDNEDDEDSGDGSVQRSRSETSNSRTRRSTPRTFKRASSSRTPSALPGTSRSHMNTANKSQYVSMTLRAQGSAKRRTPPHPTTPTTRSKTKQVTRAPSSSLSSNTPGRSKKHAQTPTTFPPSTQSHLVTTMPTMHLAARTSSTAYTSRTMTFFSRLDTPTPGSSLLESSIPSSSSRSLFATPTNPTIYSPSTTSTTSTLVNLTPSISSSDTHGNSVASEPEYSRPSSTANFQPVKHPLDQDITGAAINAHSMSSSRLQLLSLSWTQAAAAQGGAAPITFVNEVDDEDDPFDLGFDSENRKITFRYLESRTTTSLQELFEPPDAQAFLRCDCVKDAEQDLDMHEDTDIEMLFGGTDPDIKPLKKKDKGKGKAIETTPVPYKVCSVANVCDCQGISELVDKDGKNINAYTAEGLFKFSSRYNPLASGIEVIECNQYCSCTLYECSNRVAQRPRTVPIEIFKTEPEDTDSETDKDEDQDKTKEHSKSSKRGWGVRCTTQDIKKEPLLCFSRSEIVHRQTANRLQGNHGTYVFDLDGRDPPPDEELDPNSQLYSIDARNCGNWTRFLNHSCHSNLAVYTAVWDTLPEQNIPHLVFFALENIPKGTEMTVDYHAGTPLPKQKRRNVKSRPPGTNECFCGAKRCRGWV